MKIRKYNPSDAKEAGRLIAKVYRKYNFGESPVEVSERYIETYGKSNEEKLKKIFSRTPIFFMAEENGKIHGIIRGVEDRVVNLFLDGKCHGKGLGRNLMRRFEETSKSKVIRIRASIYAVGFYEKMGYMKSTGLRTYKGFVNQPMIKKR